MPDPIFLRRWSGRRLLASLFKQQPYHLRRMRSVSWSLEAFIYTSGNYLPHASTSGTITSSEPRFQPRVRSSWRTHVRTILSAIALAAFVVALLVGLVLTNVRILVFDADYYMRGYERHGGARTTGMTEEELAEATRQIQEYFRGGPPVSIVVEKEWGREVLFNNREQQHMVDVRNLLNVALRVQEVSLAYVAGVVIVLIATRRADGVRTIARWITAASIFTFAVFAVLGVLAIGDFSAFWTQFHLLSFTNDLWLLDPRTDYMIRLYPLSFWFNAVFDVIVRSVAGAIVLLVVAQVVLRWPTTNRVATTRRA